MGICSFGGEEEVFDEAVDLLDSSIHSVQVSSHSWLFPISSAVTGFLSEYFPFFGVALPSFFLMDASWRVNEWWYEL